MGRLGSGGDELFGGDAPAERVAEASFYTIGVAA
jgi:hypothetical protein